MTNDPHKRAIAGVYDRGASGYGDIGYFPIYGRRLVELAEIAPGARVLDVACGRGAALFPAAERVGPTGAAQGIDISPEMARQTSAEIESSGLANASAATGDAEALEFHDASFDRLLCAFSVQFFPNVEHALGEFRRVLKPGGIAAISTWGADDAAWDWYDELLAAAGAQPSLRTQKFDKPEVLAAVLRAAGFTGVRAVVEERDFVYPTAGDWWNMRWSISSRAGLEQLDAPAMEQLKLEAAARMEAMRQADGFHELQQVIYSLAS